MLIDGADFSSAESIGQWCCHLKIQLPDSMICFCGPDGGVEAFHKDYLGIFGPDGEIEALDKNQFLDFWFWWKDGGL